MVINDKNNHSLESSLTGTFYIVISGLEKSLFCVLFFFFLTGYSEIVALLQTLTLELRSVAVPLVIETGSFSGLRVM